MIHRVLLRTAVLLSVVHGIAAEQASVQARLAQYRTQIDGIDRQIVELLNRRAAVVEQVGKVKSEAGLAVAVPAREEQVLAHVAEVGKTGPLPPERLRRIYQVILEEMRTWEASKGARRVGSH